MVLLTSYSTIYADPPWHLTGGGKICRGAQAHYALMKTPEIIEYMKALPVAENAHLWMWVTNNFLPDGLKVIEAMGFRYVTNAVWVKQGATLAARARPQGRRMYSMRQIIAETGELL